MEEADRLADDVVVIDRGRVVAVGTPDQLKTQVGRQVLRVGPVRAADVPVVARVVTDLSGAAPEVTQDAVSAQVSDPRLPPGVLQRLTDANVAVAELSLRKPSLDEVFFALTGRHATDREAAEHTSDDDRSAAWPPSPSRPAAPRPSEATGSGRWTRCATPSPWPGAASPARPRPTSSSAWPGSSARTPYS